jgi:dephospho-CoA kinase
MIIGVTGTIGAGKETVVQYLKKKGFSQFSFSRMIRIEARKMGYGMDRPSLQKVGNLLREKYGDEGIFAKKIIDKIIKKKIENAAIDGIRSPWEINEFKKQRKDFYLIAVDAEQKKRFERTSKRGRPTDSNDFEDFRKHDVKEYFGEKGAHQQIKASMDMADFKLMNNGTYKELYAQIDDVLSKIDSKKI